ncbi:hypothetical protein [Streptomyces sp. NPDC018000]|uniref:hypothetical protein n=1 Tax=Streptomyces sp. NPDC018000 TaxID=3365028 RepID=UPI0037998437
MKLGVFLSNTKTRRAKLTPDLVAIEARKAIEDTDLDEAEGLDGTEADVCDDQDDDTDEGAKVISLHTRRLPPDPRTQLPDMAKYDRLLAPPAPPRKQQKGTSA